MGAISAKAWYDSWRHWSRLKAASLPRNSRRVHWCRQNGHVSVLANQLWMQVLQMVCVHGSCKGVESLSESEDERFFERSLNSSQQMTQFRKSGSSVSGSISGRDWINTADLVLNSRRNFATEPNSMGRGMLSRIVKRSTMLASFSTYPATIWGPESVCTGADMIEKRFSRSWASSRWRS